MSAPLVTVVAGRPDPVELAAVTVVLCALLGAHGSEPAVTVADVPSWVRDGRHVAPAAWAAAPGRHLGEAA